MVHVACTKSDQKLRANPRMTPPKEKRMFSSPPERNRRPTPQALHQPFTDASHEQRSVLAAGLEHQRRRYSPAKIPRITINETLPGIVLFLAAELHRVRVDQLTWITADAHGAWRQPP